MSVMSAITFGLPWLLLLVPAVLLLPAGRYRWLRMLTLALLVVAVAGPSVRVGQDRLVVLVDVSGSVGGGAREAVAELDPAVAGEDSTVWLALAGDTARIGGPQGTLPPGMNLQATDLARGLQVATGFEATRILLVSDGIESAGSALQVLPDVPVDTLRVERVSNARLEALLLPDLAAPGQVVEGLAVVSTDEPTLATLRLSTGGTPLPPLVQELPAGRSSVPFTFEATEGGSVQLDALIEVDYAQPLEDDRLSSELPVSEQAPVLVIDDPMTASLLRAAGLAVVEGTAADVQAPLTWSAVVLRGAANAYTSGQHELMRAYVANGGGLLMTGGPESFGFGGAQLIQRVGQGAEVIPPRLGVGAHIHPALVETEPVIAGEILVGEVHADDDDLPRAQLRREVDRLIARVRSVPHVAGLGVIPFRPGVPHVLHVVSTEPVERDLRFQE